MYQKQRKFELCRRATKLPKFFHFSEKIYFLSPLNKKGYFDYFPAVPTKYCGYFEARMGWIRQCPTAALTMHFSDFLREKVCTHPQLKAQNPFNFANNLFSSRETPQIHSHCIFVLAPVCFDLHLTWSSIQWRCSIDLYYVHLIYALH